MDPIEPVIAERNYHELKESSIVARELLIKVFIFAAVLTILILVWKNSILQFILSTTAVFALLISGWYVFTHMKTEKAARIMRKSQQADAVPMHPAKPSSKIEEVIKAIEESDTHHEATDSAQLSQGVSTVLRQRFPEYQVSRRAHPLGHRVTVDNVELHVKVADGKKALHEAVSRFQPQENKEPAFVILDMGKMDITKYVDELQKKGAKVVVLRKR